MKKSAYIFILIIIGILVLILVMNNRRDEGSGAYQERIPAVSSDDKTAVTVYYLSADGHFFLPISFDIASTDQAAKVAIERLLAGPPTPDATDSVPNDTKLLNLYSAGDTVYVDLTFDFLLLSAEEISRAVDAITVTVLPLTNCQKLKILVEGEEAATAFGPGNHSLKDSFGFPYINLIAEDKAVVLQPDFDPAMYLSVIWYLPDISGKYLVPLTALLPIEEAGEDVGQARAEAAVEKMLAMPAIEGLQILPMQGLQLQSLEISEGVAYCDFNDALRNAYGERVEKLFLSCLVRTLVSQEGIETVQLSINNEPVQQTSSGQDITQPLTPDGPVNRFTNSV